LGLLCTWEGSTLAGQIEKKILLKCKGGLPEKGIGDCGWGLPNPKGLGKKSGTLSCGRREIQWWLKKGAKEGAEKGMASGDNGSSCKKGRACRGGGRTN